jgi:uncharacterized protein YabE (DUF348 family)
MLQVPVEPFCFMATKISKKSPKNPTKLHRLSNHPFVVPVITFLCLFFITTALFINLGGQTIGASDSHVVRLNIDGKEQVLPTRAATVKDLLTRLKIEITQQDIVSPALDTEIFEDNFQVTINKARPVLIVDGDKTIITQSPYSTPREVATQAGVEVFPEDEVEALPVDLDSPSKAVQNGIAAEQVVINRATPTYLNLYGTGVSVRTRAKTVQALLDEKNVKTSPGDTITPAPETPLTPQTQIFVVRMGKEVVSAEENIPAPVETIDDPNSLAGSTVVREAGADGKKVTTYELELKNGKESGRKVIQEILISQPVKRVVVRGTKVIYSNPSANVTLGQEIAAQMGWGHEFSCIYQIFQRESGWNHLARNRSSGAYGIPQALPGSKMGAGWESDPAVQIRWGIGYMVNRYGSPCKANAFWQINHWY